MVKIGDCGVYYIAVNRTCLKPLATSIRSLRQSNPGIRIAVATDYPNTILRFLAEAVETVIPVPRHLLPGRPDYPDHGFFSKVRHMDKSPFDNTLFLDYDTYVLGDISEIFTVMEDGAFHMAMAHDVGRPSSCPFGSTIPFAVRMFNTGVLAFRKFPQVDKVFEDWWRYMLEMDNAWGDQPCFMKAVYNNHDLRFLTLPCEWNFRYIFPQAPFGEVVILHGRPLSEQVGPEQIAKKVNIVTEANRFWFKDQCYGHYNLLTGELGQ